MRNLLDSLILITSISKTSFSFKIQLLLNKLNTFKLRSKGKKVPYTLYTLNYISKVSWFSCFKNKILNTLTIINTFKVVLNAFENKYYGCDYGATNSKTNLK